MVAVIAAAGFLGCLHSTQFQPWSGPAERQGEGGSFYSKDGIDIFTVGTPPRRYRIMGVVDSSVYSSSTLLLLALD